MRAIAVLLFIYSFLGYCLFANRRLRLPLEMTPFFSASAIISALYGFGYLGALSYNRFGIPIGFHALTKPQIPFLLYGAYLLYFIGFACWALWIWDTKKNWRERWAVLSRPTVVLFSAAAVFFVVLSRNYVLVYYDEGSIWGLMAKEFQRFHGFSGVDSPSEYSSYMPGNALFHYYFQTFIGKTEGYYYASQLLLMAIAAMTAIRGLRWKNILGIIIVPFFALSMIYYFKLLLIDISVEVLLSLWFSAAILCYVSLASNKEREERPLARFGILIPGLFSLTLLKQPGFHFSLLVAGIVVISELLAAAKILGLRYFLSECGKRIAAMRFRKIARRSIVVLLLLTAPFVAKYSWNLRLNSLGIKIMYSTDADASLFAKSLKRMNESMPFYRWPLALFSDSSRDELRSAAATAFTPTQLQIASKLLRTTAGQYLPCAAVLFCLGFLLIPPAAKAGRSHCQWAFAAILPIGFVGFVLGLMISYMYSFTEQRGLILASSFRYMANYLMEWIVSLFYLSGMYFWTYRSAVADEILGSSAACPEKKDLLPWLASRISFRRTRKTYATLSFAVVSGLSIFSICTFAKDQFFWDVDHSWFVADRNKSQELAACVQRHCDLAKIRNFHPYFLWQFSQGLEYTFAKYDFYPAHFQAEKESWCLGKPYIHGDALTTDISAQEWVKTLQNEKYTHLLLGYADEQFWSLAGHLFEKNARLKNCRFYEIVPDETLGVKFVAAYLDPQPQAEWDCPIPLSRWQRKHASSGWASFDTMGVWMSDRPAEIAFSVPETLSGKCKVALKAARSESIKGPPTTVAVSVNLEQVCEIEISDEADYEIVVPAKYFANGNRDITLTLTPSNSPGSSDNEPKDADSLKRILVKSFRISKE